MKDGDSVSVSVDKLSLIKDGLHLSSCTTYSRFSFDTKINSFFIFLRRLDQSAQIQAYHQMAAVF